jgi:CelD/BcsL family acetyltransferase involved in cellulose biosynthesis
VIHVVEDARAFDALRGEWTELLNDSEADNVFLTWEWLFTWWKHLAGERTLHLLLVRSEAKLLAIAPFARSAPRVARMLPLPSLEFLGSGTVGSDYLDVIIRRGSEDEALSALHHYLQHAGFVLDLAQLHAGASAARNLTNRLVRDGWRSVSHSSGICPYISLAGHTWESYIATLGADHRYNFHRRLKNARRSFRMRFAAACTPQECRAELDQLIELHNRRWQGHGGSDAFNSAEIVRFHHEFAQLALDQQWLRLFVLEFDDVPVAALYGLFYQRVFSFYQSGYDPRYRKQSVGLLAMGLAIKSAVEDGAREYDLLHGEEAYKFHWAREVRELEHLEVYGHDRRAAVARRMRRMTRTVRRTARRVLPLVVSERISAARRLGLWRGLYSAWVS